MKSQRICVTFLLACCCYLRAQEIRKSTDLDLAPIRIDWSNGVDTAPTGTSTTYSSYAVGWLSRAGSKSVLEVSNAHSLKAERIRIILWSRSGEVIGDHILEIPALQVTSMDIATLLENRLSDIGTVELRSTEPKTTIRAWLHISDSASDRSWSIPSTSGYADEETPILHAAWPKAADGTTVHLQLHNSSGNPLSYAGYSKDGVAVTGITNVLGPHQTVDLVLPSDSSGSPINELVLTHGGSLGSFHAFLLEEDKDSKTKYYIPFSAAHQTATSDVVSWIFPSAVEPGQPVESSTSIPVTQKLLLVNWTNTVSPISVQTIFGQQPAGSLDLSPLNPGETRIVDIPLNASEIRAGDHLTTGLVVRSQGKVGSVTVSYIYSDESLRFRDSINGTVIPGAAVNVISWGGPGGSASIDGLLSDQGSEKLDIALFYQNEGGVSLYKRGYADDHSRSRSRLSLAELSRGGVADDEMRLLPISRIFGIAITTQQTPQAVEPTLGPECLTDCTALSQTSNVLLAQTPKLAHAEVAASADMFCSDVPPIPDDPDPPVNPDPCPPDFCTTVTADPDPPIETITIPVPDAVWTWARTGTHSGVAWWSYQYGNWCGAGGQGDPIDDTDAACMIHDYCYSTNQLSLTDNRNPNLPAGRQQILQACNQALCNAMVGSDAQYARQHITWFFDMYPIKAMACH